MNNLHFVKQGQTQHPSGSNFLVRFYGLSLILPSKISINQIITDLRVKGSNFLPYETPIKKIILNCKNISFMLIFAPFVPFAVKHL